MCAFNERFSHKNGVTSDLTHTGEKPFKCSECNEELSYKSVQLSSVLRTHRNPITVKIVLRVFLVTVILLLV